MNFISKSVHFFHSEVSYLQMIINQSLERRGRKPVNKRLASHQCEKALKKISGGDISALADIYEIAGRQMFAVAYNILGDYQLSEDVVQDSLLSVSLHAGEVKKAGSGLSWILRIVHNTALNTIRSRQHEIFPGEFSEDLYGNQQLGLSASSLLLQDALQTLERDDRQLVLLKAVAGLSHKEIAEILELPLAGCQKRYQRSIRKLKELLSE